MPEKEKKRYYFDWAASAPAEETASCIHYGNPSSQHSEGRKAKACLEQARQKCACVLQVKPETLFFTSGGTESNSIAFFLNLMRKGNGRIVSSSAEHASVREAMETLEKTGKPVGSVAVDSDGRVTADNLEKAFDKYGDVRFISVMAVNNETGSISDIASLADVIRKQKAPVHFHSDLVQAAGKIPLDISGWEIDSASISAHKIGGPRGIGLLYLRNPSLDVFFRGGGQENGIRGGTENVQGACAIADCLDKLGNLQTVKTNFDLALNRWKKLISSLTATNRCTLIPQQRAHDKELFSPYILQAAFNNIPGEVMARALDDLGFAVSTGSACSSNSPERPVLAAMGIPEKLRIEGIRISQGYSTTDEEIDLFLNAVAEVLKFL
ncbi:MAG: cysteine desulfurase [Treponema sp.]|nr:cysteine desulfurase [Treponema sp.]